MHSQFAEVVLVVIAMIAIYRIVVPMSNILNSNPFNAIPDMEFMTSGELILFSSILHNKDRLKPKPNMNINMLYAEESIQFRSLFEVLSRIIHA
jgi:hypothetical protein